MQVFGLNFLISGLRYRLKNLSNQIFNLEKINHCVTYCRGLSENAPVGSDI